MDFCLFVLFLFEFVLGLFCCVFIYLLFILFNFYFILFIFILLLYWYFYGVCVLFSCLVGFQLLFAWVLCVLLFISRQPQNSSSRYSSEPATK